MDVTLEQSTRGGREELTGLLFLYFSLTLWLKKSYPRGLSLLRAAKQVCPRGQWLW
ncbi:MAG: hypothetical protein PHY05_10505 [Methanothrix sp.]|nr:hypothetical protein [Methanothrix sp.]